MAQNELRWQFRALQKTKGYREFIARQIKEQSYSCFYCGTPFKQRVGTKTIPNYYFETDHVMPLSCGGTNDFDNFVLSCQPCNVYKGNKTDWTLKPRVEAA